MRALSVRDLARAIGRRSVRLPLAVGFIGILALSAGMVAAAIPNSTTGVINGCFERHTGLLRVIDVEAGKTCTRWETPISWSQAGPRGEAGLIGPQGPAGAGADGADGAMGPQGERGLQGEPGEDGDDGENGSDGEDGNTIWNGPAAPGDSIGVSGDFYLDTSTSTLYGPKGATGWGTATSLIGPPGPAGAQGPQGSSGAGAGLDSLNDIAGIPCSIGSSNGIVSLTSTGETVVLSCVPPAPVRLTISHTSGGIRSGEVLVDTNAEPVIFLDASGRPVPPGVPPFTCGVGGQTCDYYFANGTTVALRTARFIGYTWTWTGCDSIADEIVAGEIRADEICYVTMNGSRTVSVVFSPPPDETP